MRTEQELVEEAEQEIVEERETTFKKVAKHLIGVIARDQAEIARTTEQMEKTKVELKNLTFEYATQNYVSIHQGRM